MVRIVAAAAILAFGVSAHAQPGVATLTLTTRPSPLGLGQNLFDVVVKDARDSSHSAVSRSCWSCR